MIEMMEEAETTEETRRRMRGSAKKLEPSPVMSETFASLLRIMNES